MICWCKTVIKQTEEETQFYRRFEQSFIAVSQRCPLWFVCGVYKQSWRVVEWERSGRFRRPEIVQADGRFPGSLAPSKRYKMLCCVWFDQTCPLQTTASPTSEC